MLLDDDLGDFERELLEAGAREAPSAGLHEATLAAMGVTDGPRSGGQSGAKGGGSPSPRLRWIAAGIVVGVVLLGAAAAIFVRPSRPAATPSEPSAEQEAPSRAASATERAAPVPAPVIADAVPSASDVPPVAASASSPAVSGAKPRPAAAPPASGESSLADEVRALEVARRAIADGRSPDALRALDDYRRSFPHGMMQQESTLLRIEALARGGNMTAARSLADQFLAGHPTSPHAQRVRRLVGEE
jgi:hypothetical protein